jgi:hypothetical protein
MAEELLGFPAYTGVHQHGTKKGGFNVWISSDWHETKLKRGHHGYLFSPYPDDINTSILLEKKILPITVTTEDMDILREGFYKDIRALPGVEIESTDESLSETVNFFDARFTFLEGDVRRKRWVRNIYWGEAQLIVIAQGRTPQDFDYWLPMFYNAITTLQVI